MSKPPSPPETVPVMGNVTDFMKGPLAFFEKNEKRFGDIIWMKSPFRKIAVVYKPEYVKYILQENHRHYVKSFGYDALKLLLGNGLLTSEGDFWIRQRRLAQPAFHKERLSRLVNIMAECVKEITAEWDTRFEDGDPVNITSEMNRLALLIVTRTLFQSEISDKDIARLSPALSLIIESGAERIRNPFKPPMWLPLRKNRREKKALKEIKDIVGTIISSRIHDSQRYDDLLDMLVHAKDEETGETMNAAQLLDEVMTIFIAGHETTANALGFAWYLLSVNPDKRARLQQEIDDKLGNADPTAEILRNLTYTRQVIDETLRLYPPAWIIGRKSLRREKFGEYDIPAGTTMAIPTYVIQRSSANWENPLQFIPERFGDEQAQEIPKFAYFPFGGGPRLCIGNMFAIYEMMVVITMIMQRYELSLQENYMMKLQPLITLRTEVPITMQIVRKRVLA